MRFILGVILLAFLAVVGIFAVQNNQPVRLVFLNRSANTTLALLTVGVYFLGMLSGWNVVAFLRRSINSVTSEPRPR